MIYHSFSNQLQDLRSLLSEINDASYNAPVTMLGNGSIGQHTRHIIEMIQCLVKGYESGHVNYENRERNSRIEKETRFALLVMEDCIAGANRPDKILQLWQQESSAAISTTYERELLYNMEHAIHHMALIKVALREMKLNITGEEFGVAPATIRYNKTIPCAQ